MALKHEDYVIGWITALGIELACAKATLDVPLHPRLPNASKVDTNAYTLGNIGQHNVVVAGLPIGTVGTSPAAHVATNLIRSFPNVKFILMVGVAGGVSRADIAPAQDVRLGDVFVGSPEGIHGGVVQYDFGTATQAVMDSFKRKSTLDKPPMAVRTALQDLHSTAEMIGYSFPRHYEAMLQKYPLMAAKYTRPSEDCLFRKDYLHLAAGRDCDSCDRTNLVDRKSRATEDPAVHYGTIGSANQVIRDAFLRDKLYEKEGIRCFEMESSGLMDNVECLVIRGISDYCDSHKNKQWQPYASAVAAAFAKELLLNIQAPEVEDMSQSKILEPVIAFPDGLGRTEKKVKNLSKTLKLPLKTREPHKLQEAINWLAAPDPRKNYQDALELREPGTGTWLLESEAYVDWKNGSTRHIWLHGKPGCGKTVISAAIIADLKQSLQTNPQFGVAMFFFTFSDGNKQKYESMLHSLVVQLSCSNLACSKRLKQMHQEALYHVPSQQDYEDLLVEFINSYGRFFIVLDALDEASEDPGKLDHVERQKLLSRLSLMSRRTKNIHYLITSRELLDIRHEMLALEARLIAMDADSIDTDIEKYIATRLATDRTLQDLRLESKREIMQTLSDKAGGMFRWAALQLGALSKLPSSRPSHVKAVLQSLPETLDATYGLVLQNIHPEARFDAIN